MSQDKPVSFFLPQRRPWAQKQNTIWLASTLSLERNLERFKFPAKLSAEERKQIVSLISGDLMHSLALDKPVFVRAEEASSLDKELLYEYFMPLHSFVGAHGGEGFIIDTKGRFLATINVRNHLNLLILETREELEQALQELVKIETDLGKTVHYAYSPNFGFLNSSASHCGTGFIARSFLQLPALIHLKKLELSLSRLKQEGLSFTSLYGGSSHDFAGDIVIVSNQFTLGVTEETILSLLRHAIMRLILDEKALRQHAKAHGSPELMDRVSRAYGVIVHSYKIEVAEALDAISLLKLAVELDWLSGIEIPELNGLFFHCRRGHLTAQIDKGISMEELPHHRSLFLRKALEKAVLKI